MLAAEFSVRRHQEPLRCFPAEQVQKAGQIELPARTLVVRACRSVADLRDWGRDRMSGRHAADADRRVAGNRHRGAADHDAQTDVVRLPERVLDRRTDALRSRTAEPPVHRRWADRDSPEQAADRTPSSMFRPAGSCSDRRPLPAVSFGCVHTLGIASSGERRTSDAVQGL